MKRSGRLATEVYPAVLISDICKLQDKHLYTKEKSVPNFNGEYNVAV